MASKVKSFGYSGDCGYNQLLYPVESQTRALLAWLVQKLPRSEDDRAEEVLGANALLNRRIVQSLTTWKNASWRLSCCAQGKAPLRNVYPARPLKTYLTDAGSTSALFDKCSEESTAPEASIFERHVSEIAKDKLYEARLEKDGSGSAAAEKDRREQLQNFIRNALSSAKSQFAMTRQGGSGGNPSGGNGTFGSGFDNQTASLLSKSLPELINALAEGAASGGGSGGPGGGAGGGGGSGANGSQSGQQRGTRFTHAAEFSEETSASIGGAAGTGRRGMSRADALAAAAAGLDAEDNLTAQARLEAEEKSREQEIEALRNELASRQAVLEGLERNDQNTSSKVRQLESELDGLLSQSEALEREILLKRKTLEMLPSAADNIGKLQVICAASAKRLLQLAQEWETHRRPLVEKLRNAKKMKSQRKLKCKQMVDEIKKLREDMVNMVQDLKDKQERVQVLLDEKTKLPRNINRLIYTHRIMDIISSIAKQNKDIDKITTDIRDIQKTINSTTTSLQRADALAEELIYASANGAGSDKAMVDTYRRLRNLRAKFDQLIDAVTKIGLQEKLSRDLETKIDQETTRVSVNNMDRIVVDLQQVQTENAQLLAQIKAKSKK